MIRGRPRLPRTLLEVSQEPDPAVEDDKGIGEGASNLFRRSFDSGGVGNAPMGRHRLAGPLRALLIGCVVAYGEDKIQVRGAGRSELVPRLAAQTGNGDASGLKLG